MKTKHILLIPALSAYSQTAAKADSIEWINPSSGDWFASTNWTPTSVPDANSDVVIQTSVTAMISSGAAVSQNAQIWSGGFTAYPVVSISGSGTTWQNSNQIDVGNVGFGALHIVDGASVNTQGAAFGTQSGSSGDLQVLDGGTLSVSFSLTLGTGGNGSLYINQNSIVTGGATGTLTAGQLLGSNSDVYLEGSGSVLDFTDVHLGDTGTAQLEASNGASISANGGDYYLARAGGSATVTVSGGTTAWGSDTGKINLYVGNDGGTADVTITQGATLHADQINIENNLSNYSNLYIDEGAVVSANDVTLGGRNAYMQVRNGSNLVLTGNLTADYGSGLYFDGYSANTTVSGMQMSLKNSASSYIGEGSTVSMSGGVVISENARLSIEGSDTQKGVLETSHITKEGGSSVSLEINGGVLKPSAGISIEHLEFLEGFSDGEVRIGTNGATIDTAGYSIRIST